MEEIKMWFIEGIKVFDNNGNEYFIPEDRKDEFYECLYEVDEAIFLRVFAKYLVDDTLKESQIHKNGRVWKLEIFKKGIVL